MSKTRLFKAAVVGAVFALTAGLAATTASAHDRDRGVRSHDQRGGHAQSYRHRDRERHQSRSIDRRDVKRILAWQGYRHASRVRRIGRTFRAVAVSPRGREVIVILDARNGRILDTRRVGRHRGYGAYRT